MSDEKSFQYVRNVAAFSCCTKTLDTYVQYSARQEAEIVWLIKRMYNGSSDCSTRDLVDISRSMVPDSKIAGRMHMGQTN